MSIYEITQPDGKTITRKHASGMLAVVFRKKRGWELISWHSSYSAASTYKSWMQSNVYTDYYNDNSLTVCEARER